MKKILISFALTVMMTISVSITTVSAVALAATLTTSTVFVNGVQKTFDAYNINWTTSSNCATWWERWISLLGITQWQRPSLLKHTNLSDCRVVVYLYIKILNMGICAGFVALVVVLMRLLLKKPLGGDILPQRGLNLCMELFTTSWYTIFW